MFVKRAITYEDMGNLTKALQHNPSRLKDTVVCDFCGSDHPVYMYSADRMTTGEWRQCWRWTACEICSGLVDTENWSELEFRIGNRLIGILGLRLPEEVVQEAVKTSLNTFFMYATIE